MFARLASELAADGSPCGGLAAFSRRRLPPLPATRPASAAFFQRAGVPARRPVVHQRGSRHRHRLRICCLSEWSGAFSTYILTRSSSKAMPSAGSSWVWASRCVRLVPVPGWHDKTVKVCSAVRREGPGFSWAPSEGASVPKFWASRKMIPIGLSVGGGKLEHDARVGWFRFLPPSRCCCLPSCVASCLL